MIEDDKKEGVQQNLFVFLLSFVRFGMTGEGQLHAQSAVYVIYFEMINVTAGFVRLASC